MVTRHGRDVAVIIGADDYRRLKNNGDDGFKDVLFGGEPYFDELELERSSDPPRPVEL